MVAPLPSRLQGTCAGTAEAGIKGPQCLEPTRRTRTSHCPSDIPLTGKDPAKPYWHGATNAEVTFLKRNCRGQMEDASPMVCTGDPSHFGSYFKNRGGRKEYYKR
jgi:hypothetical protein